MKLSTRAGDERAAHLVTEAGAQISTAEVCAVWARKLWSPRLAGDLADNFRSICVAESVAALEGFFDALHGARWVNDLRRQRDAENKQRQLRLAARAGLRVPRTLVTNDPAGARQFFAETDGQTVAKLLRPLAVSMDAVQPFVYTNRVREEDLAGAETLRHCPMVFQELIPKARELRVAYVAGNVFGGALDASGTSRGQTDWRRVAPEDCQWQKAELPAVVSSALQVLMSELGLVFGAANSSGSNALPDFLSPRQSPTFSSAIPLGVSHKDAQKAHSLVSVCASCSYSLTIEEKDKPNTTNVPSQVFIAGDFNFELKAANETNLYTDNLKHDSESYSPILRSFRDLGQDAGDTAINDRRIDYVFGPPNLAHVGRVEVLRDAAVGRMDHWPLLAEVGF